MFDSSRKRVRGRTILLLKKVPIRIRWMLVTFVGILIAAPLLHAQFFPSTRYLTRSSPFSPTSYDQCAALNQEFAEDVRNLTEQHSQCLADAPREESSDGGICSKTSCQPLHTAMNHARQRQADEVRTCNDRVSKHLEKKRREEEIAHRAAAEAERDRKKQEIERRNQDQKDKERVQNQEKERDTVEQAERSDRAQHEAQEQQERERQAEREREDFARRHAEEQERQAAEIRRQLYIQAVTQTATHIKQEWLSRVRTGLPDVVADIVSFADVSRSMARGDSTLSMSDFIGTADNLVERAETVHAWITSPVQTFKDQIQSDAIRIVVAEPQHQATDARLKAIFHSVTKMNEAAHESNPFAKSLSAKALSKIDTQFNSALRELRHIEGELGSFNRGNGKFAGQPLVNPFRYKPTPPRPAMEYEMSNPFDTGERYGQQDATGDAELQFPSQNPFRSRTVEKARDGKSIQSDKTTAPVLSHNPFVQESKQMPALSKKPTVSSQNRVVQYRDPTTRQVSKDHP